MKKRILMVILAAVLSFGGAACGQGTTDSGTDTKQEEQKDADDEKDSQNPEADKDQVEDEGSAEKKEDITDKEQDAVSPEENGNKEEQPKQVSVYFSNTDATGFEIAEVTVAQLTPEALIAVLSTKGVLPADVQVNSFEQSEADGEQAIDLDLSESFGIYLRSMGTSGEYIVMGSICNTFLEAYDADKIHITVDGEKLETGHAEYPGYLTQFQ